MCNANKHPAGCTCGFGPPYPGGLSYGGGVDWATTVIDEPWLMRKGLEDLSWDEHAVKKFIKDYQKLVSQDLAPLTLASKVRAMLGRRKMVVEESWRETVDVPLYRFGAPRTEGVAVTYRESMKVSTEIGWKLQVFGVGTGDTRHLSVVNQRTFIATDGQCKLVFVPIPMRVQRIVVYEQGQLIGRGVRAEVARPRRAHDIAFSRRGCKNLPKNACQAAENDETLDVIECDLTQLPSRETYSEERRWASDLSRDLALFFKNVVEIGPVVRVQRVRELALECVLSGGTHYVGNLCRGRLWWASP